jgi:hypothetical protein
MSWDAIGAIGSLVGVIVTLAHLALQMRLNVVGVSWIRNSSSLLTNCETQLQL